MTQSSPTTPVRRPVRLVLLLALLAAAALGVWYGGLRAHFVPKNFGVVEPGHVYRSGRLTTGALERVAEAYGIRTVVDFGAYDTRPEQFERITRTDARLGLTRHVLPLYGDATGDPNRYVEALRVLADEGNHPVLVQCAAGSQRTGMCIVLYQTVLRGRPLPEAYQAAFEHGHDPGDNWRFPLYLGEWRRRIEEAYESGDPIDASGFAHNPDNDG